MRNKETLIGHKKSVWVLRLGASTVQTPKSNEFSPDMQVYPFLKSQTEVWCT